MNRVPIAIIGAGPFGLSLAAHLGALNIEHRIFGHPMAFWSQIAEAGGERYLKSFCFGTNISAPTLGSSFADFSKPRGLETFEPCSIRDFAAYGHWFQKRNVGWVEPANVLLVEQDTDGFLVALAHGEHFAASHVVIATGLESFDYVPPVIASLPPALLTHTSKIRRFSSFEGREVAVIGGGQSALEAAAVLHEVGASPQLLVREDAILWMKRASQQRSFWQRLRSPISGLGTGPKAWALTHFPGSIHRMPEAWRIRFVRSHLPPEGAWWLRERIENRVPIQFRTTVVDAHEKVGRVELRLRLGNDGSERHVIVDHILAGTGYVIDVERLDFLHPKMRVAIQTVGGSPRLNSAFEASVPGLHFIGPASAASFGPLFRFVVSAEYTAQIVSEHMELQFR